MQDFNNYIGQLKSSVEIFFVSKGFSQNLKNQRKTYCCILFGTFNHYK